jgi:hypothetical protein
MAASGDKAELMFMRFQVQYLAPSDSQWHNLGAAADSGFVQVGSAMRTRQSGITFTITPPRPGAPPYLLRGLVSFEWRENGVVVRHARKRTTPGHPKTAGADPVDYSEATCSIT